MKLVQESARGYESTRGCAIDCSHRDKRARAVVACLVLASFTMSTLPKVGFSQTDSSWQLSDSSPNSATRSGVDKNAVKATVDHASKQIGSTTENPSSSDATDAAEMAKKVTQEAAQKESEQSTAVKTPEVTLEFDVAVASEAEQASTVEEADVISSEAEAIPLNVADNEAVTAINNDVFVDVFDEGALEPTVSPIPVVNLSPEFRASLERQFVQIQKLEEEEDAFSDNLGESYLAYGKLLAQAGRLDEARDMYAKSLHLAKINNGVYAIEQRPVLRALFDMHGARQETAEMEKHLKQIIWLEKKNPDIRDYYTYDLILRLGNLFIDQYYFEPKLTEAALERVNSALRLFNYAVNRYGDAPLSQQVMPYGELALLQFIKSTVNRELDRSFYEQSRFRQFSDIDKAPRARTGNNHLGNGLFHLRKYLKKANDENNVEHQVRALRDIGDMYLLFNRSQQAASSYNMAWLKAAELEESHELVTGFDNPVRLPDFNYAGQREEVINSERVVKVPLNFDIDQHGRVSKIHTVASDDPKPKMIIRAKRVSKRLKFRPNIENGKIIATNNFDYDVRVRLRYGERVAQVEQLEAN